MMSYKSLINGIRNIFKPSHDITESSSPANLPTPFPSTLPVAVRIPRFEHTLSRQQISRPALKVLYQLQEAGYQAFLVGGGVRDVLLGRSPKDFDVVTNAQPEQIKNLFSRHCHLIGRRFPLAHVHFGGEVIEVATFRASPDKDKSGISQDGRILRDNVYGSTVDEDALRRDFTINALYYDISDFSLLDYANGISDLRKGIVRLIGDPELRYREDPVRMLRAARFAAKLNFTIAPETAQPIQTLANLLADVHSARLYEEVIKLFLSGHAMASFQQLQHYGLFKQLFRQTEACFHKSSTAIAFVEHILRDVDERMVEHAPILPELLFATLLWPPLECLQQSHSAEKLTEQEHFVQAMRLVITRQNRQVAIPRRLTSLVEEIWLLQPRLTQSRKIKKRCFSLFHHPYFQLGYDFLLLRATIDPTLNQIATWWTQFVTSDDETRHALFNPPKSTRSRPKRRRRSKKATQPKDLTTSS